MIAILLAAALVQCPDGAPPPCRAAAPARAATAAPDAGRIAVLPFRVTGADTSLGEGVAELLAAEFTGESGPRAVHMGTVVRGWRAAGGRVGTPLTQPVAARTARALGAGFYVDGSIVGLGNRLTVTASVVSTTDGDIRRAAPIRGSPDSLDVLVGRLTTTLLALAGGESREGSRGVLTASATAMRAYLDGVAAWRRRHIQEANVGFEAALREDSTFARAAFMRYWTAVWVLAPAAVRERWAGLVFAMRQRLSSQDRMLIEAMLGPRYPERRSPAAEFADLQRAAALLPESPEAQFLVGDWLYHDGGLIDAGDAIERARPLFARSLALDSQQTVLAHLVSVGLQLGDTALLRSLQPALEARLADMQSSNWAAAGYLSDRAWLDRIRTSRGEFGEAANDQWIFVPAAVVAEMTHRVLNNPDAVAGALADHAEAQGRPAAARALRPSGTVGVEQGTILGWMVGERDSAAGQAALRAFEARTMPNAGAAATRTCFVTLARTWQGDASAAGAVVPDAAAPGCLMILDLARAWRSGAADLTARLERADSALRDTDFPRFQGYENILLARIWEAQGNRRRALNALRAYPVGLRAARLIAFRLREEGRLAASLGHVDRALEAYRRYLDVRRDAEPLFHAERDSVRAAMARLVRQ